MRDNIFQNKWKNYNVCKIFKIPVARRYNSNFYVIIDVNSEECFVISMVRRYCYILQTKICDHICLINYVETDELRVMLQTIMAVTYQRESVSKS